MNVYSCPVCGETFEDEEDGFVHLLTHPDRTDEEIERGVAVRVKRDRAAEAARLDASSLPPTPQPVPPSPLADPVVEPAPAPDVVPDAPTVPAVEAPAEPSVAPSPAEDDPLP